MFYLSSPFTLMLSQVCCVLFPCPYASGIKHSFLVVHVAVDRTSTVNHFDVNVRRPVVLRRYVILVDDPRFIASTGIVKQID